MILEIETKDLQIPVKFHKGWKVIFNVKTERFDSPMLYLFGFLSIPDLEKAIEQAIKYRDHKP